jgi:DNA polymerase-3 subunit alpha
MQIVRDLAGYSLGRSDLVRRAMSKKKHKVMEEERRNFIYGIVDENGNVEVPGCLKNGISEESANKIFDQMMDFASYAFNKSHAAAYAVVGYQTAYLMHYYPAEYIAAMLNSIMGSSEKVAYYIRFAEQLGIQVLPPEINESNTKFTVKGNTIRFGLSALKNVGVNVIQSIVRDREEKGRFKSFNDFCNKIDTSAVNKRAVESLIKAGAFDSLGIYRSRLIAIFEKVLDSVSNERKRNIVGQINLFQDLVTGENNIQIEYPNIEEFNKKYILAMEKEMTGIYLSGHPLDDYEKSLNMLTSHKTSDLLVSDILEEGVSLEGENIRVKDGAKVIVGGLISSVTRKITKNNTMMAFMALEDLYGSIEVIVFPKTYDSYRNLIQEDEMVIINGRVSVREDEQTKVLCEEISPLVNMSSEKIFILVQDKTFLSPSTKEIKITFKNNLGNTPVYLCTADDRKRYMLDRQCWLNNDFDTISLLKEIFGEDKVKVM